jgi:hypothetical protein
MSGHVVCCALCVVLCWPAMVVGDAQTDRRTDGRAGRQADRQTTPHNPRPKPARHKTPGRVWAREREKKGGHGRRASKRGQGVCLSPNPQGNFHTVRHSIGFAIVVDEAAGAAASRGGSSLGPMRSILRRLLQVPEVPTPGVGPQTHDGMPSKARVEESGPLGSSF